MDQQRTIKEQKGVIAIITLLGIASFALAIVVSVTSVAIDDLRLANAGGVIDKTFYAAESGLNEGLYRLIKSPAAGKTYNLTVDGVPVVVTVGFGPTAYQRVVESRATDTNGNVRVVQVVADTSSFAGGFTYAVQGGSGGVQLDNNSGVIGDIYSNGNVTGSGSGNGRPTTTGSVWAAGGLIDRLIINGDAHAGSIQNSTVSGVSDLTTPPVKPFPILQADIDQWKADIVTVLTSNCLPAGSYCITSSQSLGSVRINGNLSIDNNRTLTLDGDLYITGDVTLNNNCTITINPAKGAESVRIISDGVITLGNNCTITGSGNPASFVFFISNYTSPDISHPAISLANNSASTVFISLNGVLSISGGNNTILNAGVSKTLHLNENATVEFKPALSSFFFSPAGGGGQQIGTQLGTWHEL